MLGRTPKLNDVKEKLIELVRNGVSHEDAAMSVGIHEATLYNWKKRGRDGDPENEKDAPYVKFFEEIRKAETDAKIRKIRVVEDAAIEDPKLALELLARKYPTEFGRKDAHKIEAAGKGGGPIPFVIVAHEEQEK